MIKIVGKKRAPQSFNLPHEIYCEIIGECQCTPTKVTSFLHETSSGQHEGAGNKVFTENTKLICKSISVFYNMETEVHEAALECPEVKTALDNRWLIVINK